MTFGVRWIAAGIAVTALGATPAGVGHAASASEAGAAQRVSRGAPQLAPMLWIPFVFVVESAKREYARVASVRPGLG